MDENTLCVVFDCPLITGENTRNFLQQVNQNLTPDISHIYILLNTPGGSVNHGILLFNFLKALPHEVTTHNVGQVDSMGNVVFIAGDNRYATESSTFLFHGIASGQWSRLSVEKAEEALSQLKNDEQRMTTILRKNTGFTADELREFYTQGKSITPEIAKEKGVIDAIKDVEISEKTRKVVVNVN